MPEIIFGGATVGNYPEFTTDEELAAIFALLKKHGVTRIDTAQLYQASEEVLGRVHAGAQFTLDTKWSSGVTFSDASDASKAWATRAYVEASAKQSIRRLGVPRVNVFYLHFPDANTPLAETLAGVDAVHKQGLFTQFGLSNFSPEGVQEAYDICTAKGYVLPTVYQGEYNPIKRGVETALFPLLKKLGIVFNAYSPVAGGLLTKTAQEFADGKGRFNLPVFKKMYDKQAYLDSLAVWHAAAKDAGVGPAELAYRWVAWHSGLDATSGLLVGASSKAQLEQSLAWIEKGKLDAAAVAAIDQVWAGVQAAEA